MTATAPLPHPRRHAAVRHPHERRTSALWLALPLVLMVGMRGDTRDTSVYAGIFGATTEFPLHPFDYYAENGVEWGFGLLSWVLGSVGMGPTTLFLIVSAATFFFIDRTVRLLAMSFYAVMPYYLGSFFLTQQLMQIRQGLGVAFAFWVLVGFALNTRRPGRLAIGVGAATMMHVVSVFPLISALLLNPWIPAPRRWRIAVWALALIAVSALLARAASTLQVFELVERLTIYAADEEYSSARGLFELANVRAALVFTVLLLVACTSRPLARSRVYMLLLGLYAIHVGIRLGFFDFQILSGRLSTSLGFAEVFLLPIAVRACISAQSLRMLIGAAYLFVHAVGTLTAQAPFLIDDYFTPLHANYTAR